MGGNISGNDRLNKSTISRDKIINKNGALYCNIERGEMKLNPFIMNGLKRIHKFSCHSAELDCSSLIDDKNK